MAKFAAVLMWSIVLATGIGFTQGLVAFRGLAGELRFGLSAYAALFSFGIAPLLGPVIYYGVWRGKASFGLVSKVLACVLVAGLSCAFLLSFMGIGWLSWIVSVSTLILSSIFLRPANSNKD